MKQEELKATFTYNPDTGQFTRKFIPKHSPYSLANLVGTINPSGYHVIVINRVQYRAHRLAFLYMTGSMPRIIDHIDRNKLNNRWVNLRECTASENAFNTGLHPKNIAGQTGVTYNKHRTRWIASIRVKGKYKHLGSFLNKDQAIRCRLKGEQLYYGVQLSATC